MFNTSFSFLNVCFSSFFNVLNVEGATFEDFLNLLKNVCSLFLNTFLKFCDLLLDNWFVLVLLGFGLFVSVIWLVFDLFNLSNTNSKNTSFRGVLSGLPFSFLHDNIDDYLDRKSDLNKKIRLDAEKELIRRQNAEYKFYNRSLELARKELVMRQNLSQRFNPKTNNIENIHKSYDEPQKVVASSEEQEQMKKDLEVISND